jgi:hydrogenase maturation protein HypF
MERRAIVIHGIVQGVGFRPFVYNLASGLRLTGFVKNQSGTVLIEVEGEPSPLDAFLSELADKPPPLARIEQIAWQPCDLQGDRKFRIEHSQPGDAWWTVDGERWTVAESSSSPSTNHQPPSTIFISPDVATCPDCLRELLDPADRRFGYPFLNCTNCGPRLTIIRGAPYDRQRTTMAAFAMCPACRKEYDDPSDRRFHAQPTACDDCGPQLELRWKGPKRADSGNPLAQFADALRAGAIGALKGLGGFHLTCDARNSSAVATLRQRKHRDEKPFAVMVADIAAGEQFCDVTAAERELMLSPRRPIVLLRKRTMDGIANEVAPNNPWLGVMLPYTPLHNLLMRAVDGIPLVMTSGNRSDEPIVFQNDEALARLADIADLFLMHDRPIHVRCDDSVTRVVDGQESLLRRSRGYAPAPIALPISCPEPILAVGGQLKVTFGLGRDNGAFLSHHIGDLDYFEAYSAFCRDISLYEELFGVRPQCIVHDSHPDYASTRFAQERAAKVGNRLLSVQHHHAHLASCMAENGLNEPVIGVTFDGTGYGTDGAIWGGEFLVGDFRGFCRMAHLRYVGMPGGEQAIRQPWRMAVAHLTDAEIAYEPLRARRLRAELSAIEQMLARRFRTPLTSSAGRLFDAVASLAGVTDCVSYEGQAAVQLEWLASGTPPAGMYPYLIEQVTDQAAPAETFVVDTRPLIAAMVEDATQKTSAGLIARRFHSTMADMICQVCNRLREKTGLEKVALSGGVFLNALLACETSERLKTAGFRVYRHRLVPPNDGGLSLGQLAIAAALLSDNPPEEASNVPWDSRQSD